MWIVKDESNRGTCFILFAEKPQRKRIGINKDNPIITEYVREDRRADGSYHCFAVLDEEEISEHDVWGLYDLPANQLIEFDFKIPLAYITKDSHNRKDMVTVWYDKPHKDSHGHYVLDDNDRELNFYESAPLYSKYFPELTLENSIIVLSVKDKRLQKAYKDPYKFQ